MSQCSGKDCTDESHKNEHQGFNLPVNLPINEKIATLPEQVPQLKPSGNRKQRRMSASLKRRAPKAGRDPNRWYKRIAKEMQECVAVQDLILSGKVDSLLE
jgi:hypothetical protein